MSLRKVFPQLIDTTGASDGQVLRYVDANAKVEFVTVAAGEGGTSNAVQDNLNRLEANASSNVNTVQDNVASASSNLTALDTSVDTVSDNIDSYATYANTTFGAVSGFTFQTIAVGTSGNVVANVASDTLSFVAGNNIVINADASSDSITFKASLSNATNNYFIADGSTNAFTLTESVSANLDILVSVEGLLQSPNLHYSVDSTTLTLMNTLPIENGTEIAVRWIPNTAENAPGGSGTAAANQQGTSFGYVSGGTPSLRVIEKFAFSSSITPVDVGDLLTDTRSATGTSSPTHGYVAGGAGSPFYDGRNVIEKFPFSSDSNATDVGDLTAVKVRAAGQESSTHGYVSGGVAGSDIVTSGLDTIEKFSFSADGNGIDVGELTVSKHERAGQSSSTHGYTSGGFNGQDPTIVNVIEKFPFSSDSNSTDVGDLSGVRHLDGGHQSSTHGYTAGGNNGPPAKVDTIDKFPFSSDTDATDIGNLTVARDQGMASSSSTEHGYTSGGRIAPGAFTDIVDRFAFSSDADATDVGELSASKSMTAGHQV